MAPKTQKPSKAQKEEPKEEQPAAPAVNVVGALGPNAGKTVQGMSFLSMLKKNAAPEAAAAPKEEEKKPVAVDLPAAAAPAAKSKKAKKETAAAAPVATPAPVEPVEEVQPVVEEPVAVAPVAEAPVEEAPVEEPIVEEAAVVVETASEPPATFNWADAGSDFTQFSSRTEILPAVVAEPVVEKLAPPTPQVTFRSPFTAAHGLLFVAPRLEMLLSNQLEAVRQRESQVALEQKRHEGNVTVDKNFKAQADKELLEARARLAADREALNRERNEFRQQQQQQQQQQPAPQQQHQQHHHHHHHHHHHQQHQHQGFPSHSTRHTEPAPHSWADDDFGYDAPQVQYRGTPAYNRPPMNSQQQQISGRQMSAGYPTMYNNNTPGMPRQTRPAMGPRPGGAFTHHHHHHHHHSHQQQFPSHYGGESQW